MPEWWTYTLSDFLLFSPRTYYRLIERHNQAVWPGQMVTIGLGLVIAGLLRRPAPWQGRAVSAILAVLWSWIAWAFLWRRYATINWAVTYLAWTFAIEVLLLMWIGIIRGGLAFRWRPNARETLGIALLTLSLTLYPVLAPLLHRGWHQAEVFGVVPDPTVIATIGLLLLAEGPAHWGLLVVPVLWCFFSGATLLAMGSPEASAVLAAALLAVAASAWSRRRSQSAPI
jgi:Family of unknown function (DUF6064)